MTDSDVIQDTQKLLNDELGVRWDADRLTAYIRDGVRILYARKPHAAYVAAVVVTCPSDASGIRDEYRTALAQYAAARCLMEDSADANNASMAGQYLVLSGLGPAAG
jgi:hypothetical protein